MSLRPKEPKISVTGFMKAEPEQRVKIQLQFLELLKCFKNVKDSSISFQ